MVSAGRPKGAKTAVPGAKKTGGSGPQKLKRSAAPLVSERKAADAAAAAAVAAAVAAGNSAAADGGGSAAEAALEPGIVSPAATAAAAGAAPPLNIARAPIRCEDEAEGGGGRRACCGVAQQQFIDSVHATVDAMVTLKGHGNQSNQQEGRYTRKTMWFEPDNPVLAHMPVREDYYIQPVYLVCWEYMQPVLGSPPCPTCAAGEGQVTRNGWSTQGRLVYGEHFNYHLTGFQYHCKACKAANRPYTFLPWNPEVVAKLPRELQESLPCVVFHRCALDIKLLRQIEKGLVRGIGFQALEENIVESHKDTYVDRLSSYLYGIDNRCKQLDAGKLLAFNHSLHRPLRFSSFSDPDGYAGRCPSDTLLQEAWHRMFAQKEEYLHRRAQMVGGEVLCGDGSYKFVSAWSHWVASLDTIIPCFFAPHERAQVRYDERHTSVFASDSCLSFCRHMDTCIANARRH
jgi:hypothetical protein